MRYECALFSAFFAQSGADLSKTSEIEATKLTADFATSFASASVVASVGLPSVTFAIGQPVALGPQDIAQVFVVCAAWAIVAVTLHIMARIVLSRRIAEIERRSVAVE